MTKSVVQRFEAIFSMIRYCAAVCGADVFNPEYRVNALTWLVLTAINLFLVFTIYTLYVSIYIERDWTNMLQTLCMVGSALQGYCKLLNVLWNKQHLRFLAEELDMIYKEYEGKHSDYRCYLNKSINTVSKCIKTIAATYALCTSAIILLVAYFRLVLQQRMFVMQFLLPGVDPNTELGYICMNAMHCICILFGAFGNFAADMYFFTFVSHVPLLKDILSCKFHDLNEILEDIDDEAAGASMDFLKDIFHWHQKYINFIAIIKDTYFWVVLVQLSTISLSIAFTLFCILLGKWPGGYIYLLYCFIILYLYCGLGTLVEVANDGIIDSCYNDVIWYKMSVAERKMLNIMLMMTQNTSGLMVGSVVPLSMNTGLQLTKAVYTWTMMLINFLN